MREEIPRQDRDGGPGGDGFKDAQAAEVVGAADIARADEEHSGEGCEGCEVSKIFLADHVESVGLIINPQLVTPNLPAWGGDVVTRRPGTRRNETRGVKPLLSGLAVIVSISVLPRQLVDKEAIDVNFGGAIGVTIRPLKPAAANDEDGAGEGSVHSVGKELGPIETANVDSCLAFAPLGTLDSDFSSSAVNDTENAILDIDVITGEGSVHGLRGRRVNIVGRVGRRV